MTSLLQEGDFAAFPELTTVAQLLAGQEEALHLAAERCETWYEWLVARLLYTLPTVKIYELGVHGAQAVDRFGGLCSMTTLDSVLLADLEADIPQVVRELCLSLDNFWFSVHLLDLLHHDGRERPAQHSHSDMQGAWHESASKWQQRRSNGLGAQVSGLEVHHLPGRQDPRRVLHQWHLLLHRPAGQSWYLHSCLRSAHLPCQVQRVPQTCVRALRW